MMMMMMTMVMITIPFGSSAFVLAIRSATDDAIRNNLILWSSSGQTTWEQLVDLFESNIMFKKKAASSRKVHTLEQVKEQMSVHRSSFILAKLATRWQCPHCIV